MHRYIALSLFYATAALSAPSQDDIALKAAPNAPGMPTSAAEIRVLLIQSCKADAQCSAAVSFNGDDFVVKAPPKPAKPISTGELKDLVRKAIKP